ncbi:MAG TPA: sensor histidine kinase, partial [Chthoniobacteraceae bacterium]|nr:sensor histidine kinase [Chthoniobacteraceae bacterium]
MVPEYGPWQKATTVIAGQSRGWVLAEALALLVVVGVIDFITGYEVTVFPFYSIPILFAMWFHGRNLAIAISVLSTFSWWLQDTASHHPYSQEWYQVWDAIVRWMFFLLVMGLADTVRRQRDANRARIELLERSQELEREIIRVSEREQERIGYDLHDGLGQYLVAIGMSADSLKDDLEKEKLRGATEAQKIADLLHNAVVQIRDIARGLSPVDRDEGGLEAALEELADSASRLSGISCSYICDGTVPMLDNAQSVHFFRIAQEAMNNAIKHGRPKVVVIALEAGNGNLTLRVTDDGIGLDPDKNGKGMGLNIMRYRARALGGTLEIQPNFPTGTVITCTMAPGANVENSDLTKYDTNHSNQATSGDSRGPSDGPRP